MVGKFRIGAFEVRSYAFCCRFLHVPETANFVAWVTRDPKLLIFDKGECLQYVRARNRSFK